jgi:hypothetical protein
LIAAGRAQKGPSREVRDIMPERNRSGRGTATATRRNDTPNTPTINETELRGLRVDELRDRLKKEGVGGVSAMRKDDLVKTLVNTYKASAKAGGKADGRTGGKADGKATGKAAGAKDAGGKAAGGRDAGAKDDGGKAAGKASNGKGGGSKGTLRTGPQSSKSLKYAQEIAGPDDQPERPGRSLVTTDHTVIRRWAEARGGTPATVESTERDGRPGVLRFDFPGFSNGGRLKHVSWDDWFRTFDERELNFIFQEERKDRRQSNFFRVENPGREDA